MLITILPIGLYVYAPSSRNVVEIISREPFPLVARVIWFRAVNVFESDPLAA